MTSSHDVYPSGECELDFHGLVDIKDILTVAQLIQRYRGFIVLNEGGSVIGVQDVQEVWSTMTRGDAVRQFTRRRIDEILCQGGMPKALGLREALVNALEGWKALGVSPKVN